MPAGEEWATSSAYEPYIGRWSRLVARRFIDWLASGPGARWLDIGCGTGPTRNDPRSRLPVTEDGTISLRARAWAVRGQTWRDLLTRYSAQASGLCGDISLGRMAEVTEVTAVLFRKSTTGTAVTTAIRELGISGPVPPVWRKR